MYVLSRLFLISLTLAVFPFCIFAAEPKIINASVCWGDGRDGKAALYKMTRQILSQTAYNDLVLGGIEGTSMGLYENPSYVIKASTPRGQKKRSYSIEFQAKGQGPVSLNRNSFVVFEESDNNRRVISVTPEGSEKYGIVEVPRNITPVEGCQGPSVIGSGQRLAPGQSLCSPDRSYWMVSQGDGNLVVYDRIEWRDIWASHTMSRENEQATLVMQRDCNLVSYVGTSVVWDSGTSGPPRNCWAQMQDDGNFVVYGNDSLPLWSSHYGKER